MEAGRVEAAADRLVERIKPLLAGHAPEVQGTALAQLLAIWVAGFVSADPTTEEEAREGMMGETFELVRQLVPVMYEQHVRKLQ